MDMDTLRSNAVVLEGFLCSVMEAVVVETVIFAAKSLACSLLMMGIVPNGIDVLPKEADTFGGFPISELHAVRKPCPENKDASETEDDDDDDAVDDEDDDGGNEDDAYGDDGEDDLNNEDKPEANGVGGSEGEDDDDDDDDGEEEDDYDDEEEDEEETPQPPAKKRK